ncbi:MAG: hypothetical protein BGO54_17020 [Sphingobacteriales bacterium 46-32]|nr:MAG: hypothetical protein BGO54_17020 [Sphingobacteriales bacterium 46-32]
MKKLSGKENNAIIPPGTKISNTVEDVNKGKRNSMWWAFAIFLSTIPIFFFVGNKQLEKEDLIFIENLILSEDAGSGEFGSRSEYFRLPILC